MGLFRRKPKAPTPRVTATPLPRAAAQDESSAPRGPAFSGRGLRLQHPPEVDHAAAHAQMFVGAVQDIDGITLDYSDESLASVDRVLSNFEEPGSDAVAETVLTAGFYVGEVMVRQHGYRWVKKPDGVPLWSPFDLLVVGPRGDYANPLSKTFKRVENGPEDSVAYFVAAMVAAAERG